MTPALGGLDALNDRQREAVLHDDNTVVIAGPGSGKTATLVAKVQHLLDSDVREPFSVACLTYNNDTVREVSSRLRAGGQRPGRRLLVGTVHSFCLGSILRPFARLAPEIAQPDATVMSGADANTMLERALNAEGHTDSRSWFSPRLSRIRKTLALREPVDAFDDRDIAVAKRYEASLKQAGAIDFDGMVLQALAMVERDELVRDLLAARFPWLCVDEYQDLGGPLHRIVLALADAGVKVFAVGDADQTVYDFTGADPRYLRELQLDPRFHEVRLRFNYRSGARLIAAAQAALTPDELRGYEPAPEVTDVGEIVIERPGNGLGGQAARAASIVADLLAAGLPAHDIAILYPAKGPILNALLAALNATDVQYVTERDERFPAHPIVRWLQRCAQRALDRDGPDTEPFIDLFTPYAEILRDNDRDIHDLDARCDLLEALEQPVSLDDQFSTWLARIDVRLELRAMIEAAGDPRDELDVLSELQTVQATLGDFAAGVTVTHHVAVTTYHSSKGRQFDAVLLPGLQEGLMPRYRGSISGAALAEQRRLFYVALTRARRHVYLLSSAAPCTWSSWGRTFRGDGSRFVAEVETRLAEQD